MEPLYKPEGVEERWQRTWEEEGLYGAEPGSGRETFVVEMKDGALHDLCPVHWKGAGRLYARIVRALKLSAG